jgi:hypothetical protein
MQKQSVRFSNQSDSSPLGWIDPVCLAAGSNNQPASRRPLAIDVAFAIRISSACLSIFMWLWHRSRLFRQVNSSGKARRRRSLRALIELFAGQALHAGTSRLGVDWDL